MPAGSATSGLAAAARPEAAGAAGACLTALIV